MYAIVSDKALRKSGLRLESDPMSMRKGRQLTSGMSLLLGYDSGMVGQHQFSTSHYKVGQQVGIRSHLMSCERMAW